MSRAFVKDLDDVLPASPTLQRPLSRPMTQAGLSRLRERLATTEDEGERVTLEERIAAALVTPPPSDRCVVAFGATVAVTGVGRGRRPFTIVGEDEIDVEAGRIGASSPLAQAMLGARVGDVVTWRRPAGPTELTVQAISYED